MNPLFTIDPWELPPDCGAPPTAPADFVFRAWWHHTSLSYLTDIWLRAIPYQENTYLLYFCDGHHPQNGNWLIVWHVGRDGFDEPSWETMYCLFTRDEEETWEYSTQRIYFDGTGYGFPGWFYLRVNSSGTCHLLAHAERQDRSQTEEEPNTPISLEIPPQTSRAARELLLAALDDENSEARFALQWLHLTPHQQQERALFFEHGTLSEKQTLMCGVLHSQSDLWRTESILHWGTRDWHENESFQDVQLNVVTVDEVPCPYPVPTYCRDSVEISNSQTLSTLHRWKQLLWNYFAPSFNEELFDLAQCVREASEALATVTATALSPNAHERLEAQMTLHEWWQDKFPGQSFDEFDAEG